jgi:thioredoxin 1
LWPSTLKQQIFFGPKTTLFREVEQVGGSKSSLSFGPKNQPLKETVMIKTVTNTTFEGEVLAAKNPVLVDVWATWCTPCKAMEPAIEAVAKEFEGKLDVAKLNVDENPELAQMLDVMSLPTVMLFKNGQPISRLVGLATKDRLTGAVTAALA